MAPAAWWGLPASLWISSLWLSPPSSLHLFNFPSFSSLFLPSSWSPVRRPAAPTSLPCLRCSEDGGQGFQRGTWEPGWGAAVFCHPRKKSASPHPCFQLRRKPEREERWSLHSALPLPKQGCWAWEGGAVLIPISLAHLGQQLARLELGFVAPPHSHLSCLSTEPHEGVLQRTWPAEISQGARPRN